MGKKWKNYRCLFGDIFLGLYAERHESFKIIVFVTSETNCVNRNIKKLKMN